MGKRSAGGHPGGGPHGALLLIARRASRASLSLMPVVVHCRPGGHSPVGANIGVFTHRDPKNIFFFLFRFILFSQEVKAIRQNTHCSVYSLFRGSRRIQRWWTLARAAHPHVAICPSLSFSPCYILPLSPFTISYYCCCGVIFLLPDVNSKRQLFSLSYEYNIRKPLKIYLTTGICTADAA